MELSPEERAAILKDFLIESFENLGSISEEITQLEKEPDNSELLNAIYRKIHTVKGSAGLFRYSGLQELTHSMENVLDLLRDGTLFVTGESTDVLLSSVDKVVEILKTVEKSGEEGQWDLTEELADLMSLIEKEVEWSDKQLVKDSIYYMTEEIARNESEMLKDEYSGDVLPSMEKSELKSNSMNVVSKQPIQKEEYEDMDTVSVVEPEKVEKRAVDSVVRVDVNLLDKIMNIVGELVLNRNQILQFSNTHELTDLHRLSQQLNTITSELQTDIMTTRMQPIGSILNKFERIVRDMAKETGKKIKLVIDGKDTELDRTLLEAIKDPLTHLVRNAIDHGIDTPEKRLERNKPEEGCISIKAYHEGGQVTIEVRDDGNGLSLARIKESAVQKGILSSDKAGQIIEKEIVDLIFMAGFSTAEKVTNISGRGVGMDVVKTNIEKIGGSIDVDFLEGEGTTFKLKIPLTLAIVPALIIKGEKEFFLIPQTSLVELVRLEGKKKELIEKIDETELFRLRGKLIPILRLNQVIKLESTYSEGNGDGKNGEEESGDKIINIVILNADGCSYGLIVDQILDTEEIVVKPLSNQLKGLPIYSGATIMGDGRVALILDAVGFGSYVGFGQHKDRPQSAETVENLISTDQQEIILFNLSNASSYGIPLSLVNRLEEFPVEKIEQTGNQKIIHYRDSTVPLISVEKALSLSDKSEKSNGKDVVSVFIIRIKDHYFGLVVDEILDIVTCRSVISSDAVDREGLLGNIFINEKTVTIIDVFSILEKQHIGLRKVVDKIDLHDGSKRSRNVLVVDDSPVFRKMNVGIIEELGYNVLSAGDGREALEVLKVRGNIDLIVSDIVMPNMDGLEFARSVKGDKEKAHIPMIAISSKASEKDLEEGERAGFQCYLEKYDKHEIMDAVSRLLN